MDDIYNDQRKYAEDLADFEKALNIAADTGNRLHEHIALVGIGICNYKLGEYDESMANFEKALSIAREIGRRKEEGKTFGAIGLVRRAQGRFSDASVNYEEALKIAKEIGDERSIEVLETEIGNLKLWVIEYDVDISMYGESQVGKVLEV